MALLSAVCVIGAVSVTGCSHSADANQSPQQIKAALGGSYSPEAAAQGRAYQQQEMQKGAAMVQSGGKGAAQPNTKAGNP